MKTPLSILILEDVPDDVHLIERALRRENINFTSRRVEYREEFIQALETEEPDVILSDHGLPQFNSIEALKVCRNMKVRAPFILVTGTVSEEFAVTCLKQGADDYVLKSNLSRLASAIINALSHKEEEQRRKIAEREILRQNVRLLRANEIISKANNELDHFVYSVSHNLRGPVCSMQGIINLVREEADIDHPYWKMINSTVSLLENTIQEIVQYSYNSRNDVTCETFNIEQIIRDSYNSLRNPELPITLELDIDHSVVHADANRFNIIIHNLISNAVRYSDPEKSNRFVRVSVKTKNNILQLAVADNGVGIRKDIVPRVFDMFYRGNQLSNGAGLGLYIVKEAVEKLGGTIHITTEEGIGTSLTVMLPEQSQLRSA